MKILLANNHLCSIGGTERWTETMFHALTAMGHAVDVFCWTENKVFDAPPYCPSRQYDLALVNHNTCLQFLREQPNIKRLIFTSHGVLPALERAEKGADVYVGVSEEVCELIPFPSTVIRNPIDPSFRKTEPLRETPRVLFLATRHGTARSIVERACKGLDLTVVGKGPNVCYDVPAAINRADLVIGLGRSAYEAMACGRNVVVYGYRGGDGFLTPEVFPLWRRRNLSGRTENREFTARELRMEIQKYSPELDLRELVYPQRANRIARRYLALASVRTQSRVSDEAE